MTQNKIRRLIQELINNHGDKIVFVEYDWYKAHLIEKDDYVGVDASKLKEIKLSEASVINREDYELIKEQVENGIVKSIPKVVEESKIVYDSSEQTKLRKKKQDEINKLLNPYIHFPYPAAGFYPVFGTNN